MTEQVTVADPHVVACLAVACRGKQPKYIIYTAAPRRFSGELQWFAVRERATSTSRKEQYT
eukprot:8017728-Pyramimonas_sp.AAC.1